MLRQLHSTENRFIDVGADALTWTYTDATNNTIDFIGSDILSVPEPDNQ